MDYKEQATNKSDGFTQGITNYPRVMPGTKLIWRDSGLLSEVTAECWVATKKDRIDETTEVVMRTTLYMEIKVDLRDNISLEVAKEALQEQAQLLFARMALLTSGVAPRIILRAENSDIGTVDIRLGR